MKAIKGFRLRQLGDEYLLIGESVELVNFNNLITMNETAAYLWRQIEDKEFDEKILTELLLSEYDVDAQTAERDAKSTMESWLNAGIIA